MRINNVYVRRSQGRAAKVIRRAGVIVSYPLYPLRATDALPRRKILRSRMMANTGKTVIVAPVFANVGVEVHYQAALEHLVHEMYISSRVELLPVLMGTPPIIAPTVAHDAAGPTKQLQMALEKWGAQWIDKFDLMAQKISVNFAAQNQRATETAVQGAFKKSGFTVPFKPTRASIEAYKSVAAEQIGLIKSIAQKYHTDVQSMVWESVKRGGDMRTLSKNLADTYGVTKRRAALIARDQNRKAKAVFEAVRHQELGIRQGIWMHSHAGKEPRPTHVKMNNKLYDLDKGMWDSDEGKYIQPGELINCRCTMRPFIPGFEDIRPEFEVVQT